MDEEAYWFEDELDLSQCDTLAIRKLVSALFSEALSESALSVHWADYIINGARGPHTLPLYNTSLHFLEAHEQLSSFIRCRFGTELLDWLQSFSSHVEAEEYWMRLEQHMEDSRHAVPAARKVVERGAPHQ